MKKNDKLFYASDVNVEPEEIEEAKVNELELEKIGVIVEEKLRGLLVRGEEKEESKGESFSEDWFACSNCGNVFEVKKGDRVECSGCGFCFVNKDGALIVVDVSMEEEEEDGELIEEEIEEGGEDEGEKDEGLTLELVDFDEWMDDFDGGEGGEDKEGEGGEDAVKMPWEEEKD